MIWSGDAVKIVRTRQKNRILEKTEPVLILKNNQNIWFVKKPECRFDLRFTQLNRQIEPKNQVVFGRMLLVFVSKFSFYFVL